jgi:hypothetical protein
VIFAFVLMPKLYLLLVYFQIQYNLWWMIYSPIKLPMNNIMTLLYQKCSHSSWMISFMNTDLIMFMFYDVNNYRSQLLLPFSPVYQMMTQLKFTSFNHQTEFSQHFVGVDCWICYNNICKLLYPGLKMNDNRSGTWNAVVKMLKLKYTNEPFEIFLKSKKLQMIYSYINKACVYSDMIFCISVLQFML